MRSSHRLLDARDGAGAIEYVVSLALVALVALGGFELLGEHARDRAQCVADAVSSGAASPCALRARSHGTTSPGGESPGDERRGGRAGSPTDRSRPRSNVVGAAGGGVVGGLAARDDAGSARRGVSNGASRTSAPPRGAGRASGPRLADPSYTDRLRSAIAALEGDFAHAAGGDGIISGADLERAARREDDVGEAARFVLESPSARHAADVGAGRGEIDGDIGMSDIDALGRALERGDAREVRALLADTANGRGERDGRISRDDYLALAKDESLPAGLRAWARAEAAKMPEDDEDDGCGLFDVACHVSHTADDAWDASAGVRHATGDAIDWSARLTERLTWLTPQPIARDWRDVAQLRGGVAQGMGDWGTSLAAGAVRAGDWVLHDAHPNDIIERLAPSALAASGKNMAHALVEQVDTFATGEPAEAGRAGGPLMLDVAAAFVPGGALLRGGRGAINVDARVVSLARERGSVRTLARNEDPALDPAVETWREHARDLDPALLDGAPALRVATGLGAELDSLVSRSAAWSRDLSELQWNGWELEPALNAKRGVDPSTRTIFVGHQTATFDLASGVGEAMHYDGLPLHDIHGPGHVYVSGSTRDALAAAADGLRYAFERYDELSVKGRRASEIDVPLFAPQTTGWPPESIAEWHDLARQARGREDDVDLRGELVERMKRTTRIGGSARFDEQLERRFGAAHSRAREARHRESGASDEFATPQYHDPVDDLLTRTQTQSPQRTRLSRAPAVPDELWEGGRWIGTNSRYFTHEELEAAVEPARAASGLPRDLRDSVEIVERIHGRRVVVGYRGARRPGEDTGWNRGFRVDADGRHVRWWNFEREGAYGRAPIEVRDRPSR